MIRLLISDLDGTLIHNHADMRGEDLAALRHAKEAGLEIAFASGRMHPEILNVMDQIGLSVHSISQNGAYAHLADGSLIAQHAFDPELQRALIRAGESTPFLTLLCAPDYYIVERMTPHGERIETRLLAPLHTVPDARTRLGHDIVSGKMSFFGEIDRLNAFREELKAEHGHRIDAYISDIDCMDVMPSGVSKGTGVRELTSRLGIRPEETVCIGDSFNDLSMFAETPHSYAMAGSHPDVRRRAAYETESVAQVIELITSAERR
jgi:Cof subfamily protein (haloacid dehalogenase superfamily)